MATAGGSTVVISCIMPASGSSGARQTDVTPDLPMGRRVASAAVPCSGLAVFKTRESVSPSWLPGGKHECSGLSDLDRLDDPEICDVDDGDVVRYAVGRQKVFFIGGKRHVPDALPHEKIFLDLMRRTVDHGDAIGGAERHESGLAVPGDADPDRLDGFLPQPRYIEGDLLLHVVFHGVDDANGSADFG